MLDRRGFVGGALVSGLLGAGRAGALSSATPFQVLEAKYGGRLGVIALLLRPGQVGGARQLRRGRIEMLPSIPEDYEWLCGHRADDRFAFCSSFKLSLAALVLDGAEKGAWRLDEALPFGKEHILPNSPALQARQGTITIGDAAEAVQKLSDNGAANLLLQRIGGLDRLNQFWWNLGDTASRLDDYETALNRVPLGSVRNSTTPQAMARNLVKMFRQGALSPATAATVKTWMHETTTGKNRLRAGLPADWWVGDKTGTGLPADIPGTYVDLAWVEPPKLPPFAIAAFYQPPKPTPDGDPQAEAILAEVGRIVARAVVAQGGKA